MSSASTPAAESHVVTGCGAQLTVTAPTTDTLTTDTLAAAGVPVTSDVAQRALRQQATWLSNVHCKARPDHTRKTVPVATTDPKTLKNISPRTIGSRSPNWSGYDADVAGATVAQATWTVPYVGGTTSGRDGADVSIWPGIGTGTNSSTDELIQDGTEQVQICTEVGGQCSYTYEYFFWLEMYPYEAEQEITNLSVLPGDDVGALATYDPGNHLAGFLLCNYTVNQCVTGTQVSPAPVSNSAEWIVERPGSSDGSLFALAPYGSVSLSNALSATGYDGNNTGTNGYTTAAQDGAESIEMTNCAGTQQLDSTGNLDSTGAGYTSIWLNFGFRERC